MDQDLWLTGFLLQIPRSSSTSTLPSLTTLALTRIPESSMHSTIHPHKHFNQHRRHHLTLQARIRTGLDLQCFEAVLHHHTFTLILSNHTPKARKHGGSRSHQAILAILWRVPDPPTMDSTTMARRGRVVRIQTVDDHSRISRPICSPINPRDRRSAQ